MPVSVAIVVGLVIVAVADDDETDGSGTRSNNPIEDPRLGTTIFCRIRFAIIGLPVGFVAASFPRSRLGCN